MGRDCAISNPAETPHEQADPEEGIVRLPPDEQVAAFAGLVPRARSSAAALARFEARCRALGLRFGDDELAVLAALDTPDKVQAFLNTHLYYNDDHASVDQEETAMPPRLVLRTGMAHCFEGAMFAYAVNYLHGHEPRLLMLEASQDADHNLVVWRDPRHRPLRRERPVPLPGPRRPAGRIPGPRGPWPRATSRSISATGRSTRTT
ncbi:MAG: hypothetical protein MZU91_11475 [Desulfosudis oleivorans]|nr:hypothetical protein [Desulfosudis oleivorans]